MSPPLFFLFGIFFFMFFLVTFLCQQPSLNLFFLLASLLSPGYFIPIHQGASGGLLVSSLGGRWVQARCSSRKETGKWCTSSCSNFFLRRMCPVLCLLFISTDNINHVLCLGFLQIEEDMKQNRSCPVHTVDQTVHTDEEKAIKEIVDNVLWQMAADRKSTALKQLQGHMWRSAYASGIIKGE